MATQSQSHPVQQKTTINPIETHNIQTIKTPKLAQRITMTTKKLHLFVPLQQSEHRKSVPQAPRMQVPAPLAIATVPLKPKLANLGDPLGLPDSSAISAAVGSAPGGAGVIRPGSGAREARRFIVEAVGPLRRCAVGWRRLQFSVEVWTRVAVAIARPPMVAHLLVPGVPWPTQALENALAAAIVHVHRSQILRPNWSNFQLSFLELKGANR